MSELCPATCGLTASNEKEAAQLGNLARSNVEYLTTGKPGRQRRLLVVSVQSEHQELSDEHELHAVNSALRN